MSIMSKILNQPQATSCLTACYPHIRAGANGFLFGVECVSLFLLKLSALMSDFKGTVTRQKHVCLSDANSKGR